MLLYSTTNVAIFPWGGPLILNSFFLMAVHAVINSMQIYYIFFIPITLIIKLCVTGNLLVCQVFSIDFPETPIEKKCYYILSLVYIHNI